ncbi:unnamed protein product, partial [Sphacelaria rigidula]
MIAPKSINFHSDPDVLRPDWGRTPIPLRPLGLKRLLLILNSKSVRPSCPTGPHYEARNHARFPPELIHSRAARKKLRIALQTSIETSSTIFSFVGAHGLCFASVSGRSQEQP